MIQLKKKGLLGIMLFSISLCGCVSQKEYDKLLDEKNDLQKQYDDMKKEYKSLKSEVSSLEGEIESLNSQIQQIEAEQNPDNTSDGDDKVTKDNTSNTSNPYEEEIDYVKDGYDYMTHELNELKNTILDDLKKL